MFYFLLGLWSKGDIFLFLGFGKTSLHMMSNSPYYGRDKCSIFPTRSHIVFPEIVGAEVHGFVREKKNIVELTTNSGVSSG